MDTTTATPTVLAPERLPQLQTTGNGQPVTTRTVTWETNYNNKMGCAGFVHIDLAPSKKPVRSEVEKTVIEIYTADKSHPPIKAIVFDMFFFKLKNVNCFISLASHGLDEMEFVNFMFEKYGDKINMNTEVAVYYYKRVAASWIPPASE